MFMPYAIEAEGLRKAFPLFEKLVRDRLVTHLEGLIGGSDAWTPARRSELTGSLRDKPGLRRFLRRTKTGLLRVDHGAILREATKTAPHYRLHALPGTTPPKNR